jgi:hypothetical protein
MVKCPSCKEDFGTTPMTEKMNIEELSKDSVIVNCPFCDVFLGMKMGKGIGHHHYHNNHHPTISISRYNEIYDRCCGST